MDRPSVLLQGGTSFRRRETSEFVMPRAEKRRSAVALEHVSLRVILLRAVAAFLAAPPTKEDA